MVRLSIRCLEILLLIPQSHQRVLSIPPRVVDLCHHPSPHPRPCLVPVPRRPPPDDRKSRRTPWQTPSPTPHASPCTFRKPWVRKRGGQEEGKEPRNFSLQVVHTTKTSAKKHRWSLVPLVGRWMDGWVTGGWSRGVRLLIDDTLLSSFFSG